MRGTGNHWDRNDPRRFGVRLPSAVSRLRDERLTAAGVTLWLKRDDLIHPDLPGNKWRKLKYNLAEVGDRDILTFGGAYSNHLRATAAAGRLLGVGTIGVVRGEPHLPLNPSLARAVSHGMRLTYMDRSTYRRKHTPEVLDALAERFGDCYVVPEGGSNALAVRGCAELAAEIEAQLAPDVVCAPVGTGGTVAGLAAGLSRGRRVVGFSALKGEGFLDRAVADLQTETYGRQRGSWEINYEFHHGGFAKRSARLDAFVVDFAVRHGIELERVYVAKMLSGIYEMARRGDFAAGTVIAAVITGGPEPGAAPIGR